MSKETALARLPAEIRPPADKEPRCSRYWVGATCEDPQTAQWVWFDRTTGGEIYRFAVRDSNVQQHVEAMGRMFRLNQIVDKSQLFVTDDWLRYMLELEHESEIMEPFHDDDAHDDFEPGDH